MNASWERGREDRSPHEGRGKTPACPRSEATGRLARVMPRKRALLKFCTGLLLRSSSGPHPAWGSLWGQLQTTGNLGNWAQEACLPSSVAERGHQNCPGSDPSLTSQMTPHLSPARQGREVPCRPKYQPGLGHPTTASKGSRPLSSPHPSFGIFCPLDTGGTVARGALLKNSCLFKHFYWAKVTAQPRKRANYPLPEHRSQASGPLQFSEDLSRMHCPRPRTYLQA